MKFDGVGVFIKDPSRLQQLKIIELTIDDLHTIRAVKPYVEVRIKEVIEAFYGTIESVPEFQDKISRHSTSERLRQTLRHHIVEMLDGRIDDEYLEKRAKVSIMHVHIGLKTKWYLAAFQKLEKTIRNVVFSLDLSKEETEVVINSLSKIFSFEQQIVLEEYEKVSDRILQEQQEQVKQDVRDIVGSISRNLEIQSQETHDTVVELVASTKKVNNHLQNSIHEARGTKGASEEGYLQMQRLSEQTSQINEKAVEMTGMVKELDASSSEIQAVVEMVKGIANQTKQSVEQIAVLIGGSSAVTAQVIESIHMIQTLVEDGIEQNKKSLTSFDHISGSIETTIADFENVAMQVNELSVVAERIGESSERLEEAAAKLEETIQTF